MAKKTTIKNKINREKGIVTVITTVEETDQNGDTTFTETEEEITLEEWERKGNSKTSKDTNNNTPKKVSFTTGNSSNDYHSVSDKPTSILKSPTVVPQSSYTTQNPRSLPLPPKSPPKSFIPQNSLSTPQKSPPRLEDPPKGIHRNPNSYNLNNSPNVQSYNSDKRLVSTEEWKYEVIEFNILFYINLIRQYPQRFLPLLYERQRYYRDNVYRIPGKTPIRTEEGESAVLNAIEFLKKQNPLSPLYYSFGMSQAARDHILDLGKKGLTGTNSSTLPHKTYKDRVENYGYITGHILAEHISYGSDKAQTIVLDMLIDDGDLSRSHRSHLFSKDWKFIGIGFGEHTKLRTMCVIEFCDNYKDTEKNIAIARKPTTYLSEDNLLLEDLEDINFEAVPSQRIKQIITNGPAPKFGGATLFQSGHDLGINLYSPYSQEICTDGSLIDIVFTLQKDADRTKLFLINNDMWYEVKEFFNQGQVVYHGRLTKLQRGKVGILYNNSYLLRFDVI